MKEVNISKTEYIAYLECPLKFYLIKSLNLNKSYGPRGNRDYSSFPDDAIEGMMWHLWFEEFYEDGEKILTGPQPEGKNPQETAIMQRFLKQEQQRYQENPEYWNPINREYYLQTNRYRGQIDRIDQLDKQGNLRIVEYKKRPKALDEQELLFYVNLLKEKYPEKEVTEIANYYYLQGEFIKKNLSENTIQGFRKKLLITREKMMKPTWKRAKNCYDQTNCKFRMICQRMTIPRKNNKN